MSYIPFLSVPMAALVCSVSFAENPADFTVVNNQDSFNQMIREHMMRGENKIHVKIDKKWKTSTQRALDRSNWYDYACGKRVVKSKDDKPDLIILIPKDSTLMLAAYKNPKLRKKLSNENLSALQRLEGRLQQLVTPNMPDADKLRVIHDDLVGRVTYNLKSGGNCSTIILTDKGVCEAYSRYMFLALSMVDVPCHIVVGTAGGPHAWNMVFIDEKWSHVDATWDDPLGNPPGAVGHTYYCVSDKQISKNHKWNTRAYPTSEVLDGAYFRKHKAYFTTYATFWRAVEDAYEAGAPNLEAMLTPLARKDADFPSELKKFIKKNPGIRITKFSQGDTERTIIRLTFANRDDQRRHITPTQEEEKHPVTPESDSADWIDVDMLKDLCKDFDSDKFLEEGAKLIKDAGDAGKKIIDQGKEKGGKLLEEGLEGVKDWF